MPLSEFQSFMKGKHDSGQPKVPNRSSPQSPFAPEHDFVELLWENGHVVQSNRPKKSLFPSAFPSLSGKAKEKEGRDAVAPVRDAVAPRSGRYGGTDALGNGLQATGPPGQIGLGGQDDELVPWLNCPIDDYCSEFLSEFSGINPNSLSSMVPTERITGFGQAARDVHGGAENSNGSRGPTGSSEAGRMNSSSFFQFPQQYQMLSSGIVRPRESEVTMGAADQGRRGDLPATKIPKQDLTASMPMQAPNSSTPVLNFSHFTRPVALAKANLLGVDRVRGSEKASTAASSNPLESALIEYAGGLKGVSASQGRAAPVTAKADLNPPVQPSEGMAFVGHSSEAISLEDAAKDSRSLKKTDDPSSRRVSADHTRCQDSNFKAVGQHETENNNSCHEPAIASSSVCSAIGAGAAANDIRNRAKWRCTEGEESEYPSEQDHEDDSTDVVRRPVAGGAGGQGTSKKRSRAAEVHNLSERRRRDRINEKMRALQELIPNCNKVDKASMLDEAIEYLKTLQMQVQIMSMGGGLCMPPMMLPTGVPNMRAPHLGPFSPMAAVGMGMGMAGMGFGMGMLDMTRAPTLMPIPRVHGPPYPACASIPGTAGLHHGMPGSAAANLQMFGMPGQPMPMSMPHPPPAFVPLVGGMAASVNPVPDEPVAEVQASDSSTPPPPPPPPNSKDQQQLNTLEQAAAKTSTVDTPAGSSGGRANRECFELPSMVQIDNQPPNVGGS